MFKRVINCDEGVPKFEELMKKIERKRDAVNYLNYGIKEGYYDPFEFKDMSDEELINFAERESDRGDAYADQLREMEVKNG